jgi:hypothetical protein
MDRLRTSATGGCRHTTNEHTSAPRPSTYLARLQGALQAEAPRRRGHCLLHPADERVHGGAVAGVRQRRAGQEGVPLLSSRLLRCPVRALLLHLPQDSRQFAPASPVTSSSIVQQVCCDWLSAASTAGPQPESHMHALTHRSACSRASRRPSYAVSRSRRRASICSATRAASSAWRCASSAAAHAAASASALSSFLVFFTGCTLGAMKLLDACSDLSRPPIWRHQRAQLRLLEWWC